MKAGRGLMVLFLAGLLILSGTGFILAQEQEQEGEGQDQGRQPETEESTQATEEEAEEPRPSGNTESVTVTAIRVETELMKTPIAVTVLDQDTLDREGVQDIQDMAQQVPNMDIATNNGQSTPIISMRGVRSTNETELGDPAVGVHLDGIYSPRMQAS